MKSPSLILRSFSSLRYQKIAFVIIAWCFRFSADYPLIAQTKLLKLLERAYLDYLLLRPIWTLSHQLPMYQACPVGSLALAENKALRLPILPSSHQFLESWAS